MSGKKDPEGAAAVPSEGFGVYLDSSALVKLYVPEPESDSLDEFLQGRRDILVSELCITEVISAIARRKREGMLGARQAAEIQRTLLADADSFRKLDLSPLLHRQAERLLLSSEKIPLRTLDALHIALALSGGTARIATFDGRLGEAAMLHGLALVELDFRS